MAAIVAGKQPGDTIEIEYYRGDDKRTVEVKLGERPEQLAAEATPQEPETRRTPISPSRPRTTAGRALPAPVGAAAPATIGAVTRVKICGVSDPADARRVADLGAWALGMIFWPQSPRACALDDAEEIGAELHRRLELTGVFVNATLDEVAATADRCRLTLLQLHGDEGPAYCREAARRTGAKVMKAARVHDAAQVHDLRRFHTDFHLLDAHSPRAPGGTGESFDWELALPPPAPPAGRAVRRPDARQRGRGDRVDAPLRGGRRERHRGRARPQGPGQADGVLRRGRGGRRTASPPATTEAVHP